MKKHILLSLATFAVLTVSCGEKSNNTNEESIESQDKISGAMHESDTNMVKRDGTLLSGAMDQADSLTLPAPVLEAINMNDGVSVDQMTSKRRFEEDGKTYYSVTFMRNGEESLTLNYDENGKPKSLE